VCVFDVEQADRVRLSRELDTQGQQVVALREQLSNLQVRQAEDRFIC